MPEPKFFTKLKEKWNIKSNWDFFLINVVFACAGLAIGFERRPIFHHLGIDHYPLWGKTLIYIPLIFPLYQLNLIIFGSLLGQFHFFWEKEKKLCQFLWKLVAR